MAMSCITGGKECTGCMACYDDREACEEVQTPTNEQKEDIFECLDGVKEAAMEMYSLNEYDVMNVFSEYVER